MSTPPPLLTAVGSEAFGTQIDLQALRTLYMDHLKETLSAEDGNLLVASQKSYPPVRLLPAKDKLRVLVTGGAGFVGSHLVDRLMLMGHSVIVADNLFTGSRRNIEHWLGHPNFEFIRHDVTGEAS